MPEGGREVMLYVRLPGKAAAFPSTSPFLLFGYVDCRPFIVLTTLTNVYIQVTNSHSHTYTLSAQTHLFVHICSPTTHTDTRTLDQGHAGTGYFNVACLL
ncbi:hypothetical protein AMECASPLE_025108 [Ameca splendens]|uniref:Uncharacterized protein n=1 Tax=Ameca splendens TaxID=208324 RepID=A0ABV0ZPG5_9TELE